MNDLYIGAQNLTITLFTLFMATSLMDYWHDRRLIFLSLGCLAVTLATIKVPIT